MNQIGESPLATSDKDRLAASVRESSEAWHRLGMRLRSITPDGLARILLVAGAIGVVVWVLGRSFVPLVPFLIGLTLAYITAPLVEGLDRVLPRALAVLLVMLAEVLLLLLVVAVLVVPLARQLMRFIETLPGPEQLRLYFEGLVVQLRTLPEPTQAFIRDGLRQFAVQTRDNLATYVRSVTDLGIGALFNLIKTFGFVLGLLVLPTWLYSVMADQKRARRAVDGLVPERARTDFWAVVRIVDRALSASLRGLAVQGIAVGMATYLGLAVLENLGLLTVEYRLLAAVLAGMMELIPDVGPFLWAIPAGILGFSHSPQMGLGLLGVYFLGRWLVHQTLVSRFERRVVGDIHPAFMVVAIVALSQFGLLWVFLAAPVVTISRDLFRYTYGRLSNPPRPAGLLPGEPWPAPQAARSVPARQASQRRNRRSPRQKGEVQEPVTATESR
jgi:predicted PurR-regulated permease PerM